MSPRKMSPRSRSPTLAPRDDAAPAIAKAANVLPTFKRDVQQQRQPAHDKPQVKEGVQREKDSPVAKTPAPSKAEASSSPPGASSKKSPSPSPSPPAPAASHGRSPPLELLTSPTSAPISQHSSAGADLAMLSPPLAPLSQPLSSSAKPATGVDLARLAAGAGQSGGEDATLGSGSLFARPTPAQLLKMSGGGGSSRSGGGTSQSSSKQRSPVKDKERVKGRDKGGQDDGNAAEKRTAVASADVVHVGGASPSHGGSTKVPAGAAGEGKRGKEEAGGVRAEAEERRGRGL